MNTNSLNCTALLRISQIVGDKHAEPPVEPIIPVGKSTWWAWVKSGKAPQPRRLNGITVWSAEDIQKFCAGEGANSSEAA